jgi:hypothetical protein
MKKPFIVNAPRPGRSTATIVTHVYNHQTRRTETVYLGSFNVALDPDSLPSEGKIQPGERAYGISLSPGASRPFAAEDLSIIRDWLELNGSHRQAQLAEWVRQRAECDRKAAEREALRVELETELRPRLEADIRETLERERLVTTPEPLEAAVAALDRAAEYVLQRAEELRAAGHRVSGLRRTKARSASPTTPLDTLRADANRVRTDAIKRFELNCQAAGLMAKRPNRTSLRQPTSVSPKGS